jgi:hypothetical protein
MNRYEKIEAKIWKEFQFHFLTFTVYYLRKTAGHNQCEIICKPSLLIDYSLASASTLQSDAKPQNCPKEKHKNDLRNFCLVLVECLFGLQVEEFWSDLPKK